MKMQKYIIAGLCAVVVFALTACSGYNQKQVDEWYEQYEDDGHIKRSEYDKAIDMAMPILEYGLHLTEKAIDDNTTKRGFDRDMEEIEETLDEKYPGYEDLMKVLSNADEDDMNRSTYKRWEKEQKDFQRKLERLHTKADRKFDK